MAAADCTPQADAFRQIVPQVPLLTDTKPVDWDIRITGVVLEILDRLDALEGAPK